MCYNHFLLKGQSIQQMVLEKNNFFLQKLEINPYITPHAKVDLQWIKDLNFKPEPDKLQEKKKEKLCKTLA